MARVAHKKSRRGCATCKARHVKCDETKPSCINCTTVRKRCAYLDVQSPSSALSSPGPVTLPGGITSDLVHVNALNQWCKHTQEIYCTVDSQHHPGTIMLDIAIKHSFLLHGLLALSTFHLATTEAAIHDDYLAHSHRLLAQGLEGFNAAVSAAGGLNEGNIMAAFVFSNVAGLCKFAHLFSTMHDSVEKFIESFIETITMLRGVTIVLGSWWPFVIQSDLFKALYPKKITELKPQAKEIRIQELAMLRDLLGSAHFDDETTKACKEVLEQLQSMYNDTFSNEQPQDRASGFPESVWFIRFPAAFHALVLTKSPAALIVIAHVAPLIHRRRGYWLIGNAGEVLLNGIADFLGPEWSIWLEGPQKAIQGDT